MFQYEMYLTNEYFLEIVKDLSEIMKLEWDEKQALQAFCYDAQEKIKNLFISYGEGRQDFICVDCDNKDWLYPLVVRCSDTQQEQVNQKMLQWDNQMREEYGQELTIQIKNSYSSEDTLLKRIETKYAISI